MDSPRSFLLCLARRVTTPSLTCCGQTFASAADGAVAYARHLKSEATGGATEEAEDEHKEATDGLKLYLQPTHGRSNSTGYKGVYELSNGRFKVEHKSGGVYSYIGCYGTAAEAAVAYAQHMQTVGGEAAEDEDEEEEEPEAAEVVTQVDGLALHVSSYNSTGYKGVTAKASACMQNSLHFCISRHLPACPRTSPPLSFL